MTDIRYITARTIEDTSVGIFAAEFTVDLGDVTFVDPDLVEPLRKGIKDALENVAEIASVTFDFEEQQEPDTNEGEDWIRSRKIEKLSLADVGVTPKYEGVSQVSHRGDFYFVEELRRGADGANKPPFWRLYYRGKRIDDYVSEEDAHRMGKSLIDRKKFSGFPW